MHTVICLLDVDINDNWAVRLVGRYSYIDSNYLDNLQEVTAGIRYTF